MSASRDIQAGVLTRVEKIVYQSLITYCGREVIQEKYFPAILDHHPNDLWRKELKRMVASTISIRAPTEVANLPSRSKLYDIEIRTLTAYFQRYKQKSLDRIHDTSSLTVESDLGALRTVSTAFAFASLLLPSIEDACRLQSISNHVRLSKCGFICVCSHDLARLLMEQSDSNYHPATALQSCPKCPLWCRGKKGLWWHLQQNHTELHHDATETATNQVERDSTAIIVYVESPIRTGPRKQSNMEGNTSYTQQLVLAEVSPAPTIAHPPPRRDDTWSCVKRGSLVDLRKVLQRDAIDIRTAVDSYGSPALLWAAGGGHVDIVRFLVHECGCPVDAPQIMKHGRAFAGRTALHWAARNGQVATVKCLLDECGAHVNARTSDGTTAVGWAAWQGHLPILKLLRNQNATNMRAKNRFGCDAVLWAAQGPGDAVAIIQWLEECKLCPLTTINYSGHGLLHKAAQRQRRDLCRWFLEERLLVWLRQEGGESQGRPDVSALSHLFDLINLIGPDNEGCTPSDLAGMENNRELATYMATQEIAVTEAFLANCQKTGYCSLPTWLLPSKCFSEPKLPQSPLVFAPWAGVTRMRSVIAGTECR